MSAGPPHRIASLSDSPSRGELKEESSPLEGEQALRMQSRGGCGKHLLALAKQMRKAMTPWEFKLWQQIKSSQLNGCKFRRQQPIGTYIVDFLNVEKKLIIEVDGSQHAACTSDKIRDKYLSQRGYRVLRFWNHEIDHALEGVLSRIVDSLEQQENVL